MLAGELRALSNRPDLIILPKSPPRVPQLLSNLPRLPRLRRLRRSNPDQVLPIALAEHQRRLAVEKPRGSLFDFVFRACFGFRHSDFEFARARYTIFPSAAEQPIASRVRRQVLAFFC